LKLAAHIFVADKADYYRLEDALPRYEGGEHGEGLYLPATGARARHVGDPERSDTSAYGTSATLPTGLQMSAFGGFTDEPSIAPDSRV
jgi:hypothetical protein